MPIGGLQGEFITVRPETKQAAVCDVTEITYVSKFLPGECIAQVNFNKRNLNGQNGISQRNACMRETTRIQNNKFDPVDLGLLNPVNELVFGVALEAGEVMSKLFCDLNATFFDVGKACRAINIGFTRTQQVQVGSIDEQK